VFKIGSEQRQANTVRLIQRCAQKIGARYLPGTAGSDCLVGMTWFLHGIFGAPLASISSVMPSQSADFLRVALYEALCDGVMLRARYKLKSVCEICKTVWRKTISL